MQIGFFDSGVGGITVMSDALKLLDGIDYLYYADCMHVPYGTKPKEEVKRYIFEAADFMADKGVKALVVACNTATSIAIDDIRKRYDFPIIGMEPAVKPAVERSITGKRVLVFATELTLKEEKFKRLLARVDNENIVDFLPLSQLVQYAESFVFDDEIIIPYLQEKLSNFDLTHYGTIVLGCTHFPYYKKAFKKLVPEHIDIIDGNMGTINNLKRILEEKDTVRSGIGKIEYYISGNKVQDSKLLSKYEELLKLMQ